MLSLAVASNFSASFDAFALASWIMASFASRASFNRVSRSSLAWLISCWLLAWRAAISFLAFSAALSASSIAVSLVLIMFRIGFQANLESRKSTIKKVTLIQN